jgi:autotransporter-associated beta strand protein
MFVPLLDIGMSLYDSPIRTRPDNRAAVPITVNVRIRRMCAKSPLIRNGIVPALIGFLCAVAADANAATSYYFDVNGATSGFGIANNGSYSWDDPNWSTSSSGNVATGNWVPGGFARFPGGSTGNAYTITVNNDESMAGLFNTVATAVTINAAGVGTLDITAVGGSGPGGTIQGFLLSGSSSSSVTINAPISGAGGIQPQQTGSLNLFGNNTYAGGTYLTSSGTLVNFNNNNSFGSGVITLGTASGAFAPVLGKGGSTITIANNFSNSVSGGGINFAADANTPVISSGNWSLAANNLNLRNNGISSSPLTLSGIISGTANVSLSANNSGTIIFSGANTYSGTTTVGVGTTPVTLRLGAANTIGSSSGVILGGGILDPGGFTHLMGSTTLSLTANSTIDYIAGASEIDFANSSSLTWTAGKTLNLADWNASIDKLRIGTDATGLTAAQLGEIEFNGGGLGTAGIDPNGYIYQVPEPSAVLLGLLGGLAFIWKLRGRKQ